MKFATKAIQQYLPHLRHVATLPWEIKNSIFCRYSAYVEEDANKLHFECTGRSADCHMKRPRTSFLSVKNTKSVADCGKFWSRSLARFMRAAQFASVSSCARRLLKHFRCKSLHIIRNTDDWWIPVSRDISWTVLWVCSLSSWLKTKSLTVSTFSSVRAVRGLPLTDRLSTAPVFRNFFNSLLTPCFVQLFSGNLSVSLFAVYPFKCKLFLSKSCPRRWIPCWLLTSTAVTSQWCDESPVPQINRKRK